MSTFYFVHFHNQKERRFIKTISFFSLNEWEALTCIAIIILWVCFLLAYVSIYAITIDLLELNTTCMFSANEKKAWRFFHLLIELVQ